MYKTLHRKAKIEQHEPQWKPRVNTVILKTFENTEEAIKIGQSGETSNIGHKRLRKTKHNHDTRRAGHHYSQANT